jgi:hypothetical protein
VEKVGRVKEEDRRDVLLGLILDAVEAAWNGRHGARGWLGLNLPAGGTLKT